MTRMLYPTMYMYEKGKTEGELGILGFLFSKVFPMSTVRKKKNNGLQIRGRC